MQNTPLQDFARTEVGAGLGWAPRRVPVLQPHPYPGLLISFCGIDGSGKTSTITAAAHYLEDRGVRCHQTFTPTPRIRKNPLFRELVDAASETTRARVDVLGLGLQILGDLLQHLKDTIIPRLEQGEAVLCDRYIYTSLGEIRARTADLEIIETLTRLAERVPKPDLAIALDVAPEVAEKRIRQREAERDKPLDLNFMAAQARSYQTVAEENGLLRVSSEQPLASMFAQIRAGIDACLAERGR